MLDAAGTIAGYNFPGARPASPEGGSRDGPPSCTSDIARYPLNQAMVTTAFELTNHRILRSLGVVRGVTVRSRSMIGTIGATFQTIVGGNISLLTELCEKSRAEAFAFMLRHADDLGANAIIAVRYDATEIMNGVTEVLCYGTAVVVEPA